jgi:hypothetical protein
MKETKSFDPELKKIKEEDPERKSGASSESFTLPDGTKNEG